MELDINLQIHVNGEKQILRMKDVSEETGAEIVQSFFAASGVEYNAVEVPEVKLPEIKKPDLTNDKLPKIDLLKKHLLDKDSAKSTFVSATGEPEHWKTGIKVDDDGSKRYKCHYTCECGNKGRHYIPLGTEFIECHKCGYHIDVEPAGKLDSNGLPKRDGFGNFFLAQHWS